MKIELELDLDKHLAQHYGYDEAGEPMQHPATLEDVVLGIAANQIAGTIVADEAKKYLRQRVDQLREAEIREQLRPLIAEAIARSIQPTDHYGNPKGEATTLAEVITTQAKTAMTVPKESGYGKPKRTLVEEIIENAVNTQFRKELADAIAEGKKAVMAALRDEGAVVIQQTIERMAKA